MKIQIKSWLNEAVLFEHDAESNTIKLTVEAAVGASIRLDGASLDRASLVGARLDDGSKIKGVRPIIQLGGLGSAMRFLVGYMTDGGIKIRTGCFFGTLAQFKAKVEVTHKNSECAKEYLAATVFIEEHYKIWK
jgi:hypothetical protein